MVVWDCSVVDQDDGWHKTMKVGGDDGWYKTMKVVVYDGRLH